MNDNTKKNGTQLPGRVDVNTSRPSSKSLRGGNRHPLAELVEFVVDGKRFGGGRTGPCACIPGGFDTDPWVAYVGTVVDTGTPKFGLF